MELNPPKDEVEENQAFFVKSFMSQGTITDLAERRIAFMDENGIDGVISLLQELSQSKSTILVVSHNEYLKSYFTNIVTVVKQDGCSRLEQVVA